jgi:hypothetical protein
MIIVIATIIIFGGGFRYRGRGPCKDDRHDRRRGII